jgi:6-phosphogluconolactonase (cycloisomerase 2 family)
MRSFALAATTAILRLASAATNLYISSYDGNVTSLSLTKSGSAFDLSVSSRDQGCAPNPSWLTWDKESRALYCLDEGFTTPNGSITTYMADVNGTLAFQQHLDLTAPAPVSGVIFGKDKFEGLAISHYTGQVSVLLTANTKLSNVVQQLNFTGITPPGVDKIRQAGPHEHQAILDPTGEYILVPDLGADLVRVFCWGPVANNDTLLEHPPLKVKAGSGPRHAVFWSTDGEAMNSTTHYLFVVSELGNTIASYKVTYPYQGGLDFAEVSTTNTFGGGIIPPGAAAGEIAISSDKKFLLVSNRNDSSFSIDNYNPQNSTKEISDSLATYAINGNGTLTFKQLWPAGGLFPRHFSLNKAGDMVAVGLQNSARVVVLERDVQTGLLGSAIADEPISGSPTCVVWDEE